MSTDVISPMPASFPSRLANSPLWPLAEAQYGDLHRLIGVLEVVPYNTPVARLGRTYRLIRDAHGGCMITQDGVIVATGNLSEGESNGN